MRLSRIFVDSVLQPGTPLGLDRETSHYLGKVLRLQSGNPLIVFNSEAGEFSARIESVSKQQVVIEVAEQLRPPESPAVGISLGLGVSRGDRMDFAIQKSTELGVANIFPLYTEFGEVRIKQAERAENKRRHWQRIAINACEQSGRIRVPHIDSPLPLSQWLDKLTEGWNVMLEPTATQRLSQQAGTQHINLLVGPEGGFSEQELQLAQDKGFVCYTLGSRVLRTETAPVAALAILQYLYGEM